jgi:hypothetical protein
MRTRLRVETPGTRRRKGLLRALSVMGVAYVLTYWWSTTAVPVVRASGPGITDLTVIVVSAGIVGIGTLTAVVLLIRRPRPLVEVAGAHRFVRRSARKLVRRIRRNWLQICRQSQVTIEQRVNPSKVMVHAPRVAGIRPSALGIDIRVRTIPGQPAQSILEAKDRFSSALGVPLRATEIDKATVCLTAVLRDPLKGIRAAGNSCTTRVVVGRCDDGSEAVIDLADAAHIAVQGMTRSGKSALLYTILGQVFASESVHISGIDPNQVLLGPLADASETDSNDFALGADPVGALKLLGEACRVMDERARGLKDSGIAAYEEFTADFPIRVIVLEEYAGLLRQAAAHDEGLKPAERTAGKIKQRVGRLVSEGAKTGIRVILITQRAEASIIDGDSRGQFGTRITMAVDNADSVRLLHPQASPEIVEAVVQFPVGRALFWQHRQERIMQCDFTEYEEYGRRLGLSPVADTEEEIIQ